MKQVKPIFTHLVFIHDNLHPIWTKLAIFKYVAGEQIYDIESSSIFSVISF